MGMLSTASGVFRNAPMMRRMASLNGECLVLPARLSERAEDTANAFAEFCFGSNEAEDEMAVCGEIEEVAGVNENGVFLEERDSQVFIAAGDGNAKGGVPASVALHAADTGTGCQFGVEFKEVVANTVHQL